MLPPKNPLPKPEGDIAPYPSEALDLGGGRYMYVNGKIVTKLRGARAVEIKANTRNFWEKTALEVHGKPLSELMA